ncbi:MAG: hypothetical protein JJT88_09315 [Gammaproteobacteria bacterium]|nr:hypothetical protein [Gammaproteobacteria bacterium]
MRNQVIAALGCTVLLALPVRALPLDELADLTDDTIQSACHGYLLHAAAERLAAWFGTDSPLCQRIHAGESPRAAIAALRQEGITTPRSGSADFRALPDPIAMECGNDQLCIRERRRARDLGQPLDMATYTRVQSHCEDTAHRVFGAAQGVYGCIEQTLADWPQLRLTRPVRLLPMQGDYEVRGTLVMRDAPREAANVLSELETRRPLTALARSEDGRWLQVRDQLSGAEGFVPTTGVQRVRETQVDVASTSAAAPPSLDIDALVRSGQVSRQHQLNEMERLQQARREEEARLAAERDRVAREREERERVAAVRQQQQQRQASQQSSGADTFMRGLAGAAIVGLGAAAVDRGVPVDRASEVVAAGMTDILTEGGAGASARVLEQAQAGAGTTAQGTSGGPSAGRGTIQVLPHAFDAAGRPRYRECSIFNNPTGYDALALIRLCNAAERQYGEYEQLARSGADSASVQRAWEAHRSAAADLIVLIDSQSRAKQANGF